MTEFTLKLKLRNFSLWIFVADTECPFWSTCVPTASTHRHLWMVSVQVDQRMTSPLEILWESCWWRECDNSVFVALVCLFVSLFVCLFVCLFAYLLVCLLICLFVYLLNCFCLFSLCLLVFVRDNLFVYLFILLENSYPGLCVYLRLVLFIIFRNAAKKGSQEGPKRKTASKKGANLKNRRESQEEEVVSREAKKHKFLQNKCHTIQLQDWRNEGRNAP